ncbi:hypothetical protein BDY24DRAFT_381948 [Mrakia frigida]|uniref:DUF4870 domain-containing protein n=1 Tax=Mrakia frigida TaxID=29902 RepID=UPI003FCC2672
MSFAPYQPPPDLPPDDSPTKSSSKQPKRPWFNRDASSFLPGAGYQSGGSNGVAQSSYSSVPAGPSQGSSSNGVGGGANAAEQGGTANSWETRFGWRVDFEAAGAYVLGPLSALVLLILETTNDYVRFHAYQSALLTTPLLVLHFFISLLFWRFLKWIYVIFEIGAVGYMVFRAYTDANRGLERFYLPVIGDYADRWVGDE